MSAGQVDLRKRLRWLRGQPQHPRNSPDQFRHRLAFNGQVWQDQQRQQQLAGNQLPGHDCGYRRPRFQMSATLQQHQQPIRPYSPVDRQYGGVARQVYYSPAQLGAGQPLAQHSNMSLSVLVPNEEKHQIVWDSSELFSRRQNNNPQWPPINYNCAPLPEVKSLSHSNSSRSRTILQSRDPRLMAKVNQNWQLPKRESLSCEVAGKNHPPQCEHSNAVFNKRDSSERTGPQDGRADDPPNCNPMTVPLRPPPTALLDRIEREKYEKGKQYRHWMEGRRAVDSIKGEPRSPRTPEPQIKTVIEKLNVPVITKSANFINYKIPRATNASSDKNSPIVTSKKDPPQNEPSKVRSSATDQTTVTDRSPCVSKTNLQLDLNPITEAQIANTKKVIEPQSCSFESPNHQVMAIAEKSQKCIFTIPQTVGGSTKRKSVESTDCKASSTTTKRSRLSVAEDEEREMEGPEPNWDCTADTIDSQPEATNAATVSDNSIQPSQPSSISPSVPDLLERLLKTDPETLKQINSLLHGGGTIAPSPLSIIKTDIEPLALSSSPTAQQLIQLPSIDSSENITEPNLSKHTLMDPVTDLVPQEPTSSGSPPAKRNRRNELEKLHADINRNFNLHFIMSGRAVKQVQDYMPKKIARRRQSMGSSLGTQHSPIKLTARGEPKLKAPMKRRLSIGSADDAPREQIQDDIRNDDPFYDLDSGNCRLCTKSSKTMDAHYIACHRNSEVFCSRIKYNQAVRIKQGEPVDVSIDVETLEYVCFLCEEKQICTTYYEIYKHLVGHTGEFYYKCMQCDFRDATFDIRHAKLHPRFEICPFPPIEDKKLVAFMCEKCHFVQLQKNNLKRHIVCQHRDENEKTLIVEIPLLDFCGLQMLSLDFDDLDGRFSELPAIETKDNDWMELQQTYNEYFHQKLLSDDEEEDDSVGLESFYNVVDQKTERKQETESEGKKESNIIHTNPKSLRPWIQKPSFKSPDATREMLSIQSILSTYKCMAANCTYFTSDILGMEKHLDQHDADMSSEDDVVFECCYCPEEFDSPVEYFTHIYDRHGSSRYYCPYCFYRSNYCNSLHHVKIYHQDRPLLVFDGIFGGDVNEKEPDPEALIDAVRSNVTPSECTDCGKRYFPMDAFQEHLESHGTEYTCETCCLSVPVVDYFPHLASHDQGPFQCIYCPYGAVDGPLMKRHLIDHHCDEIPYVVVRLKQSEGGGGCDGLASISLCNLDEEAIDEDYVKFVPMEIFNRLRGQNDGIEISEVKGECEEVLANSDPFILNLPESYIFERPIQCPNCNYSTEIRGNLIRHWNSHNGITSFNQENDPVNRIVPYLRSPTAPKEQSMEDHSVFVNRPTSPVQESPTIIKDLSSVNLEVPKYVPGTQRLRCGAANCNYFPRMERTLKVHISTVHAGEGTFKCPHCRTIVFDCLDVENIITHYRLHDSRLLKCALCPDFYGDTKHAVYKHIQKRHKNTVDEEDISVIRAKEERPTVFKCSYCEFESLKFEEMISHGSMEHGYSSQYQCSDCGKDLNTLHGFKVHATTIHSGKCPQLISHFTCSSDKVDSTPPAALVESSEPEVHGIVAKKECDSHLTIQNHYQSHAVYREIVFYCEKCPKTFNDWGRISEHYKQSHDDSVFNPQLPSNVLYSCFFCEFNTPRPATLADHFLRIHKELTPLYRLEYMVRCFKCEFTNTAVKVQEHYKEHHPKNRPLMRNCSHEVCGMCSFQYKDENSLEDHFKLVHRKITNQSLKIKDQLKGLSNLKIVRLFKCKQCKEVLNSHQVRFHPHSKHCVGVELAHRFRCRLCPFLSMDYRTAKTHVNTHKKKSMQCERCCMTFADYDSLFVHIKSHRHIADYVAELTEEYSVEIFFPNGLVTTECYQPLRNDKDV